MRSDEAQRARQEKWRREGFAHEAKIPTPRESPLFYIVVLGLLLPFVILTWPFDALARWWDQHRRHGRW